MHPAVPTSLPSPSRRAPRPTLALAVAALQTVAPAPLSAQDDPDAARRFPTVSSSALSGRKYSLPRDFGGRANLVFVAVKREQQRDVDTWLPAARALASANPELRFYELPTMSRGYVLMRPVIVGGMRGGIPDPGTRDVTITLYTNVGAFREALGLESDRTVYALLLDEGGAVRWRAAGAFTREQGDALARRAATLLAGPTAPAAGRSVGAPRARSAPR